MHQAFTLDLNAGVVQNGTLATFIARRLITDQIRRTDFVATYELPVQH